MKLANFERYGMEVMVFHSIVLLNHQRSLDYADNLLDSFVRLSHSGEQLVHRCRWRAISAVTSISKTPPYAWFRRSSASKLAPGGNRSIWGSNGPDAWMHPCGSCPRKQNTTGPTALVSPDAWMHTCGSYPSEIDTAGPTAPGAFTYSNRRINFCIFLNIEWMFLYKHKYVNTRYMQQIIYIYMYIYIYTFVYHIS